MPALRSAKEGESCETYDRAGGEVPEREGAGVGKGPLGTQEQDGEQNQRRSDRTADGQDYEPG